MLYVKLPRCMGLPWWLSDKESVCNAGDQCSISGLGRSPGGGNGNPLQCLAWKTPWTEESGSYSPEEKELKVNQ